MHYRRLISWVLGFWISGSLCMIVVATQNFRSVDRLLAAPSTQASELLTKLGPDARSLLRYQASEQNRFYFATWEMAQLVLGALLAFMLVQSQPAARKLVFGLALAIVAAVMAQRFYLTPEIVRLGRVIDFVPQGAESLDRDRFWPLHHAYSGLELFKLAALGAISLQMIVRSRRGSDQVDAVDEADYRHVNR